MRATRHVLRDDDQHIVIVGWDHDLESFYVDVRDGPKAARADDPVLDIGRTPRELPTISSLITAVERFARLGPAMISALRHDAAPLGFRRRPRTDPG